MCLGVVTHIYIQTMVQGGGSQTAEGPRFEMPFPPILFVLFIIPSQLSGMIQYKRAAPLAGCLINLVADYRPGGSLRDPPSGGPAGPPQGPLRGPGAPGAGG